MTRDTIKQALIVQSAASAGFYLGGRYVGELAAPTYQFTKPEWIAQAQQTMWIMLAVAILSAVVWLALDYHERGIET